MRKVNAKPSISLALNSSPLPTRLSYGFSISNAFLFSPSFVVLVFLVYVKMIVLVILTAVSESNLAV